MSLKPLQHRLYTTFDKMSQKYIGNIYSYSTTFFKCFQKVLATFLLSVRQKSVT